MSDLHLPEDLGQQLEAVAADQGLSPDAWAVEVLRTAIREAREASDAAAVHQQLDEAGLLARIPRRSVQRPDPTVLVEARKRAGQGKPLSEYVSEGRD